jgi:hypothetical protein
MYTGMFEYLDTFPQRNSVTIRGLHRSNRQPERCLKILKGKVFPLGFLPPEIIAMQTCVPYLILVSVVLVVHSPFSLYLPSLSLFYYPRLKLSHYCSLEESLF